jgi:hypothetical protein
MGRFINADDTAYLGVDGKLISYNLFTYCKNNPVVFSDPSGCFALLPFLGAVVGGAIGGTIISTVSYLVGSALCGQEITAAGILNAAATGAVSGAIGGAIGTISLGATVATMVAKGVASVALGLGIGVKTGMECEGSTGKRIATGITTGFFVAGGTFLGAQIDTSGFGFAGTAFTNFATTLFVGTPVEIMSVTAQQGISYTDSTISGGTSVPYLSFMSLSSKYSMATVG